MKIAVIGANGQLGSDIVKNLTLEGLEIVRLTHQEIEIAEIESVSNVLKKITGLKIVINTAAMHNVPDCEKKPNEAFKINAIGSWNLAKVCKNNDWTLMHISTDYVFNGLKKSPYLERDYPSPLNAYGNSKLAGENFIEQEGGKHYIIRVSGIYGESPCRAKGNNFAQLMLKLSQEKDEVRVVDDEILTPTFTLEIARQIFLIIKNELKYGLYHLTAQGSCSWYQFAKKIFEIKKINTKLSIANPNEFASDIKRPKYSVLKNQMLIKQKANIMKHWSIGLKEYLDKIK